MCVYGPPGPGFENTDLNKTILDMSSGLILPKRNEWLYFFLDHLRQKEGCLCVCVWFEWSQSCGEQEQHEQHDILS